MTGEIRSLVEVNGQMVDSQLLADDMPPIPESLRREPAGAEVLPPPKHELTMPRTPVVSDSLKEVVHKTLIDSHRTHLDQIPIERVVIGDRLLALNSQHVDELAKSMKVDGLLSPIIVNWTDTRLIAGRHRLAAAEKLGWKKILCKYVDVDDVGGQIMEIVENLRRLTLTKEERDKHLTRYAELLAARPTVQSGQKVGHNPEKIASKIAKTTGLSRQTVARAIGQIKRKPAPEKSAAEARAQHQRERDAELTHMRAQEHAAAQERIEQRDRAPIDAWTALLMAWDAATADIRTRFAVEKEKEIAAARPKARRGRPPGTKNKKTKPRSSTKAA